jgi:hypothetical protein
LGVGFVSLELWVHIFFFFFFFFFRYVKQNYKKEKTLGLDNPKLKLRTKVSGSNASEDAG